MLGFFKYFLEEDHGPHVKYFIMDKEPAWAETWSDLDDIITGDLRPSRNFVPFDIREPTTYEKFNRIFEADIFTMIHFLSEVFAHKDAVTRFLNTCFERMKKGTLFIVIDFKNADLQSLIDQCAKEAGLQISRNSEETTFFMDPSEDKAALQKYADRFGIQPKIKSQVFFRLFRKPIGP